MSTVVKDIYKPYHETDRFSLYEDDCRSVLPIFADCSVDSIVTDPPYELGFMGKGWDRSGIAYDVSVWRECLRVLKPGGHLLAFGGSRTYHRLACAIEDAGFEIRDDIDFWYDANPLFAAFYDSLSDEQKEMLHASAGAPHLSWVYGSGFPKSLDVSKAIDTAAGAEREIIGMRPIAYADSDCWSIPNRNSDATCHNPSSYNRGGNVNAGSRPVSAPVTDAAKQWNGWGTALKPAHEPIVLARKPLIGTVAENILQHGTGGLNIDGCRIETGDVLIAGSNNRSNGVINFGMKDDPETQTQSPLGRWPANVIHDGSDEVLVGFPDTESGSGLRRPNATERVNTYCAGRGAHDYQRDGDSGSAARFFYCAKAAQKDRNEGLEDLPIQSAGAVTDRKDGSAGLNSPRAGAGRTNGSRNNHPTVKPTELMRYLSRLITPPGGLVLDPFCGSGSTGKAAMLEGFKFVGIELNADYCQLAQRRIEAVTRQGLLFA